MKEICDKKRCSGCGACRQVCAQGAITMKEDRLGCLHPVIDCGRCTSCGLCSSICPVNNPPVFQEPQECFAAWVNSFEERKDCASGGIATSLTKLFLENGGSAYGTRYSEGFTPVIDRITTSTINLYKGSKYVQSVTGDAFVRIKTELQEGRQVLFIGTPCQVAGLYGFLHKPYDNLTTCDLVCHGVCPPAYLQGELAIQRKKHLLLDISDVKFRSQEPQYNYALSLWDEKGRPVWCRKESVQPYFRGFLANTTLRESCHHCQYATLRRIADISLGDDTAFDKSAIDPSAGNVNVSLVLVNTGKGRALIDKLAEDTGITFVQRDTVTETAGVPSLTAPAPRPFRSRVFRFLYPLTSYRIASRAALCPQIWYKKLHHAGHILRKKLHI